MKRHINSLLQRKRADFDSAQKAAGLFQRSVNLSNSAQQVEVRDGYDWLREIRVAEAKVRSIPSTCCKLT